MDMTTPGEIGWTDIPECHCKEQGQRVLPEDTPGGLGGLVVHRADCKWLEWDHAHYGGCQGDV